MQYNCTLIDIQIERYTCKQIVLIDIETDRQTCRICTLHKKYIGIRDRQTGRYNDIQIDGLELNKDTQIDRQLDKLNRLMTDNLQVYDTQKSIVIDIDRHVVKLIYT